MSERPDLALLTERQITSIRYDLRGVQAKQPWAAIRNRDIDSLDYLALTLAPESHPGRGHDCQWLWSNGEIIISGNCDVYGNGYEATYCQPQNQWLTADDKELEP